MAYGKIYETTWWGASLEDGFGSIYYDISLTELEIITLLRTRSSFYEENEDTTTIVNNLQNCE